MPTPIPIPQGATIGEPIESKSSIPIPKGATIGKQPASYWSQVGSTLKGEAEGLVDVVNPVPLIQNLYSDITDPVRSAKLLTKASPADWMEATGIPSVARGLSSGNPEAIGRSLGNIGGTVVAGKAVPEAIKNAPEVWDRIAHPEGRYNLFGDSVYNMTENAQHIAKAKPELNKVIDPGNKFDTPYKKIFEDPSSPIKRILDTWDTLNNRVVDPRSLTQIFNSNKRQLTGQLQILKKAGVPLPVDPSKLVNTASGLHRAFAQVSPNVEAVGPAAAVTYRMMEGEPGAAVGVGGLYYGTVAARKGLSRALKVNYPTVAKLLNSPLATKNAFAPPPVAPIIPQTTATQPQLVNQPAPPLTGPAPSGTAQLMTPPAPPPTPPRTSGVSIPVEKLTEEQIKQQLAKRAEAYPKVQPTPRAEVKQPTPPPAGVITPEVKAKLEAVGKPVAGPPKPVALPPKSAFQSFSDRIRGTSDMRAKQSILQEAMQFAKENPDQLPYDKITILTQRAHVGRGLTRPPKPQF